MARRKTYTYGVMPSREDFSAAFEQECPEGTFTVGNDPLFGNHTFENESELWTAVSEAANRHNDRGDDGAGQFASAVLDHLGFEWV